MRFYGPLTDKEATEMGRVVGGCLGLILVTLLVVVAVVWLIAVL